MNQKVVSIWTVKDINVMHRDMMKMATGTVMATAFPIIISIITKSLIKAISTITITEAKTMMLNENVATMTKYSIMMTSRNKQNGQQLESTVRILNLTFWSPNLCHPRLRDDNR